MADEELAPTDPRYQRGIASLRQHKIADVERRIEELQLKHSIWYKQQRMSDDKNRIIVSKKAQKCKELSLTHVS